MRIKKFDFFRTIKMNPSGFTLAEVLVATGFMSILSLLIGGTMVAMNNSQLGARSQADVHGIVGRLQKAITTKNINASSCTAMLSLQSTPQFGTSAGKTDVEFRIPGAEVLRKDLAIPGSENLQISQLYMTNNVLVSTVGSRRMYVSDLVVEFNSDKNFGFLNRKRNLTTFSITMDGSTMISCNTNYVLQGNKDFCDGLSGMVWSRDLEVCVQAAQLDNNNEFEECPPGTWKKDMGGSADVCIPVSTDCGYGKIAKGYKNGLVSGCVVPTIGTVGGTAPIPNAALPPPALPGAPASDPSLPVTTNPYMNEPPGIQVISESQPPAPADDCVGNTYIDQNVLDMCNYYQIYCDFSGYTAVDRSNCVAQENQTYSTPNLTTATGTPPSPSPPNDNTCMCNNRRINDGESCMFCSDEIGMGYGFIDDDVVSVATCNAGTLENVSNPGIVSGGPCRKTWYKAYKDSMGRYSQE